MATRDRTPDPRGDDRPAGNEPARKPDRDDERIRKEGDAESSGDAPMDPADEAFIDKK